MQPAHFSNKTVGLTGRLGLCRVSVVEAVQHFGEPDAAYLRRTKQLWPQVLSDSELEAEYQACAGDRNPLSLQMVWAELKARRLR